MKMRGDSKWPPASEGAEDTSQQEVGYSEFSEGHWWLDITEKCR